MLRASAPLAHCVLSVFGLALAAVAISAGSRFVLNMHAAERVLSDRPVCRCLDLL